MASRFSALRIAQTTQSLPPWRDALSKYPPSDALTRPVFYGSRRRANKKGHRAKRLFQPVQIKYKEDKLRQQFFGDHPWELARPMIVLEGNGNAARDWDWSQIEQLGKKLDGESVVQRQIWLRNTHKLMTAAQIYDKARKELYRRRQFEDIERRVAFEEALHTGAYFAKGAIEVGMQLEDESFENWKLWARREMEVNASNDANSDIPIVDSKDVDVDEQRSDAQEDLEPAS